MKLEKTNSAASSSFDKDDYSQQNPQDVGSSSQEPILKVRDPFLYYSNGKIRMRELRLQDMENDSSDDRSSSSSLSSQDKSMVACERKTRITFELHPSLVLEDLMRELFEDDDNSLDFDDILDASLRAVEQDSGSMDDVMNGLKSIILG